MRLSGRMRSISLYVVVFFLGAVACMVLVFDAKMRLLLIEDGRGVTPHAVVVSDDASRLVEALPGLGGDACIFLTAPENGSVRFVLSNDFGATVFPVYQGRSFEGSGRPEALVGSAVSTTGGASGERFEWGGVSYDVVGRLGLQEESLMSSSVLLHASGVPEGFLSGAPIVDGKGAVGLLSLQYDSGRMAPVFSGAATRTDGDYVFSLMKATGVFVLAASALCAGYLAGRLRANEAYVRRLTGTQRRFIAEFCFEWALVFVLAAFLAFAAMALVGRPMGIRAWQGGVCVAALSAPFALAAWASLRVKRSG